MLSSRLITLTPHVILNEWLQSFYNTFFNVHGSGVLTALSDCCMAGATWNCWQLGTSSIYTRQPSLPCNSLLCHFIQNHIHRVHACLAVTCHLHFWQNGHVLLYAAAVTQGWNRYRNKSQHRKLTLEKKIIPPFLWGLKPETFWSWVWCSNHWDIPAPAIRLSWQQINNSMVQ